MQRWHGTCEKGYDPSPPHQTMNNIVYIIGAVVIIIVVLKVLGLF